eukprot:SRR837773.2426.p2 GENE.SRR837773.2426~~SRR837773.2426.p2  ORF type:complete len:263 (+),score=81.81 SRR837773.2426:17-805(+)
MQDSAADAAATALPEGEFGRLSSAGSATSAWTEDHSRRLQEAINELFGGKEGEHLRDLKFSLSIADPGLPDCPLIGCSEGFCELTGYDMDYIVGRNCRFLIDPVPDDTVNKGVRVIAKDYVNCVRDRKDYEMPDEQWQDFMPKGRHKDSGVFCLQTNSKKDGTLFRNMFYLKEVSVNDRPYIIGLQTEVDDRELPRLHEACRLVDRNMVQVQKILASMFWCSFGMWRQESRDPADGFVPEAAAEVMAAVGAPVGGATAVAAQ